jgi:hypothetical protein
MDAQMWWRRLGFSLNERIHTPSNPNPGPPFLGAGNPSSLPVLFTRSARTTSTMFTTPCTLMCRPLISTGYSARLLAT